MKELSLIWSALTASWIPERDSEISIQDFIRINTCGREEMKAGLGQRIYSKQTPTQSYWELPSALS